MATVYVLTFYSGIIVEATGMSNVHDLTFISCVIVENTGMTNIYDLTFISGVIVRPYAWRMYTTILYTILLFQH